MTTLTLRKVTGTHPSHDLFVAGSELCSREGRASRAEGQPTSPDWYMPQANASEVGMPQANALVADDGPHHSLPLSFATPTDNSCRLAYNFVLLF